MFIHFLDQNLLKVSEKLASLPAGPILPGAEHKRTAVLLAANPIRLSLQQDSSQPSIALRQCGLTFTPP